MNNVVVIGASGFVGKNLARELLREGFHVRCLARHLEKVHDLSTLGGEPAKGDLSDPSSMSNAIKGVEAVLICTHSLSPQNPKGKGLDFMEIELEGLHNIVAACREHSVRRVVYISIIGVAPSSPSAWSRGRWKAEQYLLTSGLDVTIIRHGLIVGRGGQGFEMIVGQAKKRVTPVLGNGETKMRHIAIEDLVYYLIGALREPHAYGRSFDVGSDEVRTTDQIINATSDTIGRTHPIKIHIPLSVVRTFAPLIERFTKMPKGAIKGVLDGADVSLVGDPNPIREILPKPLKSYAQAIQHALK